MRRKTLALFVLVLAIPTVALAATAQASSQSTAAPKVLYILKGTLWNYTAATTTTSGSVTIHVTHSNYHAKALVGKDLTFAVSAKTTTKLNNATTIKNGVRGVVKFRAPLRVSNTTLLATVAPNHMTALQVIDQGSS